MKSSETQVLHIILSLYAILCQDYLSISLFLVCVCTCMHVDLYTYICCFVHFKCFMCNNWLKVGKLYLPTVYLHLLCKYVHMYWQNKFCKMNYSLYHFPILNKPVNKTVQILLLKINLMLSAGFSQINTSLKATKRALDVP